MCLERENPVFAFDPGLHGNDLETDRTQRHFLVVTVFLLGVFPVTDNHLTMGHIQIAVANAANLTFAKSAVNTEQHQMMVRYLALWLVVAIEKILVEQIHLVLSWSRIVFFRFTHQFQLPQLFHQVIGNKTPEKQSDPLLEIQCTT